MKKKILSIIACLLIFCAFTSVTVFAAEESYTSYINSSSSFLGPMDFWSYKNLGYKYTNSYCPTSGAYFNVNIRRYKSEESLIYKTVGTCNNNKANVENGTYWGYTFNDARHDGKTYDYGYNYYIQIKDNKGEKINAKTFIKYSRDY